MPIANAMLDVVRSFDARLDRAPWSTENTGDGCRFAFVGTGPAPSATSARAARTRCARIGRLALLVLLREQLIEAGSGLMS